MIEGMFSTSWLEKRVSNAFIVSFLYSFLCIIILLFIFGPRSGIVSVFLISLLLIPTLDRFIKKKVKYERKQKDVFSFKKIFKENNHIIFLYVWMFLGIFSAYIVSMFFIKLMGINLVIVFKQSLLLEGNFLGGATFILQGFMEIVYNNWWVLLIIFVLSLVTGYGGIFFITWNAASWGVILAYRVITAALYTDSNPFFLLGIVLTLTIPYLIIETTAYIMAAVSGITISKHIISKTKELKRFLVYSFFALLIYLIIYFLILSSIKNTTVVFTLNISTILLLIFLLSKAFSYKNHRLIFLNYYNLFLIAIILFFIGVVIEIFIINNAEIMTKIYAASMLYGGS